MTPREIVLALSDIASEIESLGDGEDIAQLNTDDALAIRRESMHLSAAVQTLIERAHVEPMEES
jgi:hypothetical protein